MPYLMFVFICACSSDSAFETKVPDYEIDHESLSVMISEDVIQHEDQYKISFAREFGTNPIMEIDLFNHSSSKITFNESSLRS